MPIAGKPTNLLFRSDIAAPLHHAKGWYSVAVMFAVTVSMLRDHRQTVYCSSLLHVVVEDHLACEAAFFCCELFSVRLPISIHGGSGSPFCFRTVFGGAGVDNHTILHAVKRCLKLTTTLAYLKAVLLGLHPPWDIITMILHMVAISITSIISIIRVTLPLPASEFPESLCPLPWP